MDIAPVIGLIRRRWVTILTCLLAGLVGAALTIASSSAVYESKARVFFNLPGTSSIAEQAQGFQVTSELLASYAKIATSGTAAQQVSQRLNGALDPSTVKGRISAVPEQQTLLLDVTATGPSPGEAQRLSTAATDNLVALVDRLEADKASRVRPEIVDAPSYSTAPISPRKKLDIIAGLLIGLLVGLLAAGLVDSLDRRLRTVEQVPALTRLPELGRTPKSKLLGTSPLAAWTGEGGDLRESFRSVRTAVQFLKPDAPPRSILVTSPVLGEGKTTTALNLAVALAASGERVILVDADLRRAGLTAALGLDRAGGLTSAIREPALVDEFLQAGPHEQLRVLSAGALPPDPSEMLGSQNMATLVQLLVERADVVVFDGAPVMPVTDAVTFSTQVDVVILVVRERVSLRTNVSETVRRLEAVGAAIGGFVLNGVPPRASSGYVYGKDSHNRRLLRTGS